jgi:hypothetical protein
MLDNNPAAVSIAAAPIDGPPNPWTTSSLYQLHNDGSIWKYTGPPLSGWQKLDDNPGSVQIVTDNTQDVLYQVHSDGTIWLYKGPPLTGWQLLS